MSKKNSDKQDQPSTPQSGQAADEAAEAAYYLETLKANKRVAEEPEPLGPDQTHRIETDEEGRKVLRRKRFSAV